MLGEPLPPFWGVASNARTLCMELVLNLPEEGLQEAVEALRDIIDFHVYEPPVPRFGESRFVGTTTVLIDSEQRRPELVIDDDSE